jgi:hypothetical protein
MSSMMGGPESELPADVAHGITYSPQLARELYAKLQLLMLVVDPS